MTNPIPETEKLPQYYESTAYLSHQVDRFSLKGFLYDSIRHINIRRKYRLISHAIDKGSILDIGMGTGELLSYFAGKGWKTTGVEPNEAVREFARTSHGLTVHDEEALDKLPSGSFDVITMWHVLEHVPDLNARMKQVRNLLKKEGRLFIAVPNLLAPDAKKYGAHWAALDVPRHLYHFTPQSLEQLLRKHGFILKQQIPMKFDAYYVSLLSEQYIKSSMPYLRAILSGFRSNRIAGRTGNYSSMIFAAEQIP